MDQAALVDSDIDVGRRLTEELDKSKVPLSGSLWLYAPESAEWRLILATPMVDQRGPTATYAAIQKALRRLKPPVQVPLRRIVVSSPQDPFIRVLRNAVKTGGEISGIRFTHNTINNHYIEDAYIYRLQ